MIFPVDLNAARTKKCSKTMFREKCDDIKENYRKTSLYTIRFNLITILKYLLLIYMQ